MHPPLRAFHIYSLNKKLQNGGYIGKHLKTLVCLYMSVLLDSRLAVTKEKWPTVVISMRISIPRIQFC